MKQLLELLMRNCQLTNIQLNVDEQGNLELYPIFLEANRKGLLSVQQFEVIQSLLEG